MSGLEWPEGQLRRTFRTFFTRWLRRWPLLAHFADGLRRMLFDVR